MYDSNRIRMLSAASCVVVTLVSGCGSAQWLVNGFLDPSQVGNFVNPVRLEIRSELSLLEEPLGIQDAEEPTFEDTQPMQEEARIKAGDIVRVSIFELMVPGVPSEQTLRVPVGGFVSLPVLGSVHVEGWTARELEMGLKVELRNAGVLDNADVQAALLQSESMNYTVVGAVRTPGVFPLNRPDLPLSSAIAQAGGVPDNIRTVYVLRRGPNASASPTTAPTSRAIEETDSAPFTMSEVSNRGGGSTSAPARPVNEIEILEATPVEDAGGQPVWDEATQQWILVPSADRPVSGPGNAGVPQSGRVGGMEPVEDGIPGTQPADEDDLLDDGTRVIEVPVKGLLQGDPRYNVVVRPNDLINVPLGNVGEYFMAGNVSRPGAYNLSGRRITVKQAVASAGGYGPLAWPSRADLIRRVSDDEEQTIQIDLDAIHAGRAPDFYLRPNDVLQVGSHPVSPFLAVIRNAFRVSYGFGFVYDRNFADSDTFNAREQVRARRQREAQLRGVPF